MTRDVFVCEQGWEHVASEELHRALPQGEVKTIAPGWLEVSSQLPSDQEPPCVAFCQQVLPQATDVRDASISAWAAQAGGQLLDTLAEHEGPWRLHVFNVPEAGTNSGARRCTLVYDAIGELLRKKQRRLLRSLVPAAQTNFLPEEAIVQVGLVDPTSGFVSSCLPAARKHWRRCISRLPGGRVEVQSEREAPSRAMMKLRESQIHLGREIQAGETCVDLGSSPGSWAWLALTHGATLTAVDRSPLRDDLMANPHLTFVRGDAFEFEPAAPVDWLLCDVIAFPQRSGALLETWLQRRWCRRFVVTIKFRGVDDYPRLEPIKQMLQASGAEFMIRRLASNKNEATVIGEFP